MVNVRSTWSLSSCDVLLRENGTFNVGFCLPFWPEGRWRSSVTDQLLPEFSRCQLRVAQDPLDTKDGMKWLAWKNPLTRW